LDPIWISNCPYPHLTECLSLPIIGYFRHLSGL
jgi:hypothetical protein